MVIRTRPGTNDEEVVKAIIENNEYELPSKIDEQAVVVDIGAHIGAFIVKCRELGARQFYAFEPDHESLSLLKENTSQLEFGSKTQIVQAAVIGYGEPGFADMQPAPATEDGTIDLAGSFIKIGGSQVRTISFDAIVNWVWVVNGRDIDILKIDCEGSEWPILYESSYIHRARSIFGEYHELTKMEYRRRFGSPPLFPCDKSMLRRYLNCAGFSVAFTFTCPWDDAIGGFRAWRKFCSTQVV